jgi:SAM-dependent methyltransferase
VNGLPPPGEVRHLPRVVATSGEPPDDIGTGHPMREVTERVAADPRWWDAGRAAQVAGAFDELAAGWDQRVHAGELADALGDALDRGGHFRSPVVELGAGTGGGTRLLAERFPDVVAGDLSAGMLARLDSRLAHRLRLDASRLPLRSGSVGTLVCVNMLLFAGEVRRVLGPGGALVWVNSIGPRTPIHLSAGTVSAVLGADFEVVASEAGWGTWAVAHRLP